MTAVGVNIHWQCVPKLVEKLADGRRRLVWTDANDTDQSDTFDTVLWAIGNQMCVWISVFVFVLGREPRLDSMHLSAADIDVDRNSRRVLVDDRDRTSTENVYAIGDIAHV
jgi:NAD(P)H-nitrite reductase large subunit